MPSGIKRTVVVGSAVLFTANQFNGRAIRLETVGDACSYVPQPGDVLKALADADDLVLRELQRRGFNFTWHPELPPTLSHTINTKASQARGE